MKHLSLIIIMVAIPGCFSNIRPQANPMVLDRSQFTVIGYVTGISDRTYFLSVIPLDNGRDLPYTGPPSFEDANQDALSKSHGDVILNPGVDVTDETYFFGLYRYLAIKVSGYAVKLK